MTVLVTCNSISNAGRQPMVRLLLESRALLIVAFESEVLPTKEAVMVKSPTVSADNTPL